MKNKTLTVFTPAYNRKHTIVRTFDSLLRQTSKDFNWLIVDDGSTDETKEWVQSLASNGEWIQDCVYDRMGLKTSVESSDIHFYVLVSSSSGDVIRIDYIRKPNGGLFTGYNVAYDFIQTELCVCVDSDDFMPDNAVEIILQTWHSYSSSQRHQLAGIVGLDFNIVDKKPIGGLFSCPPSGIAYAADLHHVGDTKYVFRTELMKKVAPQIGFEGEKDFNPHYMQMQVLDKLPILVINKNLCWVEYQIGADSMSQAIFKQYIRSARSYVKYRLMELSMVRGLTFKRRVMLCAHYTSACIFAKDKYWLKNSQHKVLTLVSSPLGVVYNLFIRYKAKA